MPISSAVDQSAVARVVGIKTEYKDLRGGSILFLPQRLALIGQGSSAAVYDTTKRQVTGANEVASIYGFGSPLHLAAKQLYPVNGDGVGTIPVTVYPLNDAGSGVPSSGDITPVVAATDASSYRILVNKIPSEAFVVSVGDTVADVVTAAATAINANLDMPVIASDDATEIGIESKWAGTSANDIFIEIVGPTDTGITFAVSQPSGGLVNPDVQDSLDQVGNVWESMFLNCMEIGDTDTLDKFSNFGEGRWGALVKKPMMSFTGNTIADVNSAVSVSDSRRQDRTNSQLVAPGSNNLPFVVAARELVRVVKLANNNPPHDYGSQLATGIVPGTDQEQWDYVTRDSGVKRGSSTVEVKDGVVSLSDTVTFYHPDGDPIPAYRHVVDIVKLQNITFNLDLIFNSPEWDGAPLILNEESSINPSAKKPKMAVAAVYGLIDSLADNAIITNRAEAKASVVAQINDMNPKRLDISFTVKLSGNSNIISIDYAYGFQFGSAV